MTELLSGYAESTQELMLRVYASEIPETGRRQTHREAHFAALDLLGAALAKDFGVLHAVTHRIGLGKPKLMHDFLYMNLSHCKGLAVAAVGKMPLGVDAETPRAVRDVLMQKVCAPEAISLIQAEDDQNSAFSRFWTRRKSNFYIINKCCRICPSNKKFTIFRIFSIFI